jgi:RNA polymerase sigma-70 factor (ECF subfamily)
MRPDELQRSEWIAALSERPDAAAIPTQELETLLASMLEAARTAWPELDISGVQFFRHVARHLVAGDTLSALRAVRAIDLYLALGCSLKEPQALALFSRHYQSELDRAIYKMQTRGSQPEDLQQILLEKLFVDDGGRGPKIASYSGYGELRSWVRVTAVRTLIDLIRGGDDRKHEQLIAGTDLEALGGATTPPESEFLKKRYEGEFVAAVQTAMQTLSVRQRNLLRHQLLDGLTLEAIASVYRVHRVTVARWLAEAREQLADATRKQLTARLGATGAELESLAHLVRSRLDMSIRRLFASASRG